jgi:hypothetical protein
MKLGLVIPTVGPAISSAAGLSAFCRGLEDLGYDTLWVSDRLVTPVDMQSTYPGKEQPYPPQMTLSSTRILQVKALKVSETQVTSSPSSNRNGAITR